MRVKKVTLNNFRNYIHAQADLSPGRNILLGDNAQGKSNVLEAVEILANGYSDRALMDNELIRSGQNSMQIALSFQTAERQESLGLTFHRKDRDTIGGIGNSGSIRNGAIEKIVQVNGVTYATMRKLRGRLATVSFKSEDLGLMRAGPKFRRDWLERLCLNVKPSMHDKMSRYQKVLVQRNRLLKRLLEQGKITVAQSDELKVWDEQVATYGAAITAQRVLVLQKLLPEAIQNQSLISGQAERLAITYQLRRRQEEVRSQEDDESEDAASLGPESCPIKISEDTICLDGNTYPTVDEKELFAIISRSLRLSRYEEIARKQTLFGPHRDDITFSINDQPATAFASQGQQRSLVLCLKLSELKLVTDCLLEPPILILDDVLAELDLHRQTLLMSLVEDNMQTLISTTHLTGFQPQWLERALFLEIEAGTLRQTGARGEYDRSDRVMFSRELD
jgi:DNA replication and repair protein RecF